MSRLFNTTSLVLAIAFLVVVQSPRMAEAITVVNAGSQLNFTGWRTSADNTLSFGDGEYGTDGYRLFGAAGERSTPLNGGNGSITSDPIYATTARNSVNEVQFNYAQVDNPVDGTPLTIVSGTTTDNSSGGAIDLTATITLGAGVPSAFRLGLMNDNLDGTAFVSPSYEIRDGNTAAVLATVSTPITNHNQVPDWYFVDVTGAVAGDIIEIHGAESANGFVTLGALTFDSAAAIPEPTTATLGLIGLAGLMVRRRRAA